MTTRGKNVAVLAAGLLLLMALVTLAANQPAAANGRDGGGAGFSYNHYQYNYPHELPTDYVFRTGRLFSPVELEHAAAEQDAAAAKPQPKRSAGEDPLAAANIHALVGELLAGGGDNLRDGYSLAVTTPVSLHQLYATSSFGRLLGERLLGELQRSGLEVIDVRKTPALMIHQQYGEYGLSRDMNELSFVLDAQAVLVGTYAATDERLRVDLRILRNQDSRVLASARRDFDMTREIRALLADEGAPRRAVSVPVRGQ